MDGKDHYEELMRQIKVLKDRVRGVVYGQTNGVYIHGRPGTSKTYTVCSTLDKLAARYTYSNGHLTPIGLFDLLAEHRDKIIVLDDVSAIFGQPIALQLLLAALGSPHTGSRDRPVTYKTARETRKISFSGGVVCISNLPLDGHHHAVLAALKDRAFVINYEPTEEQIIALVMRLAEEGVGDVSPDDAKMVATYLIAECASRGVRPSVRLFVDKALRDFMLFAAGQCETHWRDLVVSNLEQTLVELKHPTNDLTRADQIEAERRMALDIHLSYATKAERLEAWKTRAGKSQAAYYRRLDELKKSGQFLASASNGKAG